MINLKLFNKASTKFIKINSIFFYRHIIILNLTTLLDKALLIIMAKWHGFGRCKTRLSKDIGKSNSAKVQSVMTKHTISVAKFLQKNKILDKSESNNGKLLASLIVGIIIEIFDKTITFYFQYQ